MLALVLCSIPTLFIWVLIEMCLFLKMVLKSWNAFLALACSDLDFINWTSNTSYEGSEIFELSTCCSIESLSLILDLDVSCFLEMTMVTVVLVFSPRPAAWLFSFMMLSRCRRSFSDVAIGATSSAYRRSSMVWPPIVMPGRSPISHCRVTTSPVKAHSLVSLLIFILYQQSKTPGFTDFCA